MWPTAYWSFDSRIQLGQRTHSCSVEECAHGDRNANGGGICAWSWEIWIFDAHASIWGLRRHSTTRYEVSAWRTVRPHRRREWWKSNYLSCVPRREKCGLTNPNPSSLPYPAHSRVPFSACIPHELEELLLWKRLKVFVGGCWWDEKRRLS